MPMEMRAAPKIKKSIAKFSPVSSIVFPIVIGKYFIFWYLFFIFSFENNHQ
jgi:hypothetical protein